MWINRSKDWPERLYLSIRRYPQLSDVLLVGSLAVVLLPSSLAMITEPTSLAWRVVLRVSLMVTHLAPALRRTLPVLSFSLVSGAAAVQTLAPVNAYRSHSAFMPSAVVFLTALYAICLYGKPWSRVPALVVGIAGAIMITVRTDLVLPSNLAMPGGEAAWLFVLGALLIAVFAAWGAARFRQVRVDYLELLEERARRAEAEREERTREAVRLERIRIARDIHDVVAHALVVVVTQAQGGALIATKSPQRSVDVFDTIATTARHALSDMRRMLGVLRTPPGSGTGRRPGDESGPRSDKQVNPRYDEGANPQPTLADLNDMISTINVAGLAVRRVDRGSQRAIGKTVELTVYRIVQEALTNTLRHAGPTATAELVLAWTPETLTVTVTDNGRGPNHTAAVAGGAGTAAGGRAGGAGHGLVGMRERVAVLGGSFAAGSAPGADGGFRIRAVLPITDTVECAGDPA